MKTIRTLILGMALLVSATAAHALTFDFNTVISGATPAGLPPWLSAEFTDVSGVAIKDKTLHDGVVVHLTASGLVLPSEFVSKWTFNSTLQSLAGMNFFVQSTTAGTSLKNNPTFALDNVHAGAQGAKSAYDIGFEFMTSNGGRFQQGDLADIFLYGVSGLNAASFDTTNNDGYYAEAHIQGIGTDSSWVVPVENAPVPEPGTMVLLGAGFLGLAIYGKRRKNS